MAVEAPGETPGLSEHEQAMVAAVDAADARAAGEVPEYIEPIVEEVIDYKALYEAEKAKATPEVIPPVTDAVIPPVIEEGTPPVIEEGTLSTNAMNLFAEEFAKNGALSEESYASLGKKGISKEVVDTYIEGQTAIQAARSNQVFDSVGGESNYRTMLEWAKETWEPSQIEVFNTQVQSTNQASIMFGVEALKAKYIAAQGSPMPSRPLRGTSGGSGGNEGSKGFSNKTEMQLAMNNKAYGKDPAYTQMVMDKVGRSTF